MLACSRGAIEKMKILHKKHPKLARFSDFVMGYTALHWGAKLGRCDIVKYAVESGVDVHGKSHVSTNNYYTIFVMHRAPQGESVVALFDIF